MDTILQPGPRQTQPIKCPRNRGNSTHQPPGRSPTATGQRPRDLGLELGAADHQRAHGAAIVLQRPLRRRLREPRRRPAIRDAPGSSWPAARRSGPHGAATASPTDGGRASDRRAGPPGRGPDRAAPPPRRSGPPPGATRPRPATDQPLGVATIGLDPIARARAGSTPARRPSNRRRPRPACARARTRWPRLIGRAHRPRQTRRERDHLIAAPRNRCTRSSPNRDPTSRPPRH